MTNNKSIHNIFLKTAEARILITILNNPNQNFNIISKHVNSDRAYVSETVNRMKRLGIIESVEPNKHVRGKVPLLSREGKEIAKDLNYLWNRLTETEKKSRVIGAVIE